MGFSFVVGQPETVFHKDFAASVRKLLETKFACQLRNDEEPFYSEELGWSWWGILQERAAEVLGPDAVRHLQAVRTWQGVYLPLDITPQDVPVDSEHDSLQCASLEGLLEELQQFGIALDLPVEEPDLSVMAASYREDDDLADEGHDIQTYLQAMIACGEALRRCEPMWLVK